MLSEAVEIHPHKKGRWKMALANLEGFDRELSMALSDLKGFQSLSARDRNVWSPKQQEQLNKVFGAVLHLFNAVAEVVGKNR